MAKFSAQLCPSNLAASMLVICLFLLTGLRPVLADQPNPAFGDGGWAGGPFLSGPVDNDAFASALQADGKIVVVGTNDGLEQDIAISRYNTDGSLDTSFDGDGKVVVNAGNDDEGFGVAIQADGKIVVVGTTYSGLDDDFLVLRLNADGSPDTGFGVNGIVSTDITGGDEASDVVIKNNGKIVVAGSTYDSDTFKSGFAVVRYNSDGTLDPNFDTDGKVTTVIGGSSRAFAVTLQADGKVVLGGRSDGASALALARYSNNGSLDTTFDTDGIVTTPTAGQATAIADLAIQVDGKILGVSRAEGMFGPELAVWRYNTNGSLDTGFDSDGIASVPVMAEVFGYAIAIQADGKIVAVGESYNFEPLESNNFLVARFNSDGSVDTGFDVDGYVETEVTVSERNSARSAVIQTDGKIVVAGQSNYNFGVVRYNADGSLDAGFSGDGKVITSFDGPLESGFQAVVVQDDGKIVVGGFTDNSDNDELALARYKTDGSLDASFGGDGKVTFSFGSKDEAVRGLAVQSDGKILAVDAVRGATSEDAALVRFNADGSIDGSFGGGVITTNFNKNDVWNDVVVQPDGKIVVAGGVKGLLGSGIDDIALARFNSDGSFDAGFAGSGKFTSKIFRFANDIELQRDGKILVAGYSSAGFPANIAVARFNEDGSIDTSFGGGDGWFVSGVRAKSSADERMSPLALQCDGKIIVAGDLSNGSNNDIALTRYTAAGVLDTTFDVDGVAITDLGANDDSREVRVQADGKILVGGFAQDGNGVSNFVLVRYNPDGSLDSGFADNGVGLYERGGHWHEAYAMEIGNGHAYLAGQVNYDGGVLDVQVSGAYACGAAPALETIGDVTGMVDISGDGVPDIALLRASGQGQPLVRYFSGASRKKIKSVNYFGPAWSSVAAATVADSNANGVANDPAVAVLAHKASTGEHAVEVRRANNGVLINKIFFLSASWEVIDMAIIDDKNGDGVTGDTAIAVLAVNPDMPFSEQIRVQVRKLSDGKRLANWSFLNGNWTALALEAINRIGRTPLLAVLANKTATGANVVQARKLMDGSVQRDTSFMDSAWTARDVAIIADANGDGNASDPAYLVLSSHQETGRNKVQIRWVSDGKRLKNITMLGTNWRGTRVTGVDDISGNLREEIGVLAEKRTDGKVAIQLKDIADRTTTATIFP
jgi:uncharacterized delta-60 repeat protein